MINVNQITSQLARMPDPALQKYAQMHKDDPYVMALAMSEFNRRKQMRQGAQANAPEQPKVVDQAIQSMAAPMPENVGIGQLPAGDMNFAEGGIVAFGDGGEVERYQSGGMMEGFSITPEQIALDELRRQEALRKEAARRAEEARYNALVEGRPVPAAAAAPNTPAAPATASGAPAAAAPDAGAGGPRQNTAGRRNTGTPPPPAAAAATSAQDPLIAQLLQPVTAAPVNFEAGQATFPTLEQIERLYADNRVNPENVVDPLARQREELVGLAALQNAQEQSTHAREVKERGLLGEKQEARLKAREEKLGKQEKDIVPLAMLQAGFAIMGGSSRSALQNIGAGAQVGLRGYAEGIERLKAARERIEDGLERIETARRSEGILDSQQRSALRRDGNKIILDGKRESINAMQQELNASRSEATARTNAGIKMLTDKAAAASAERRSLAEMQAAGAREAMQQTGAGQRVAAQLTTQERIAGMEAAAKQSDAAARLAELRSQVGAKNEAALVADYAKNPMKLKILEQTDPTLAAFIRQRIQAMTVPQVQNVPGTRP